MSAPNFPSADRRQSFRSRLQRALSLSSSESEDPRSPSRSAAGDTTEEEKVHQEDNGRSSRQGWDNAVNIIEEDARQDWNTGQNLEKSWTHPDSLMSLATAT